MHKTIKIRRIDSRTIKTRRREAQLTDSFGEALYLGLAPRPGREQQKTVLRQSLYWLDRKITAIQRPKQSVCSWLPIGRVMKESFMARALNKNKKPETKNKNRACNYFLGSFGSPCGFCDSPPYPLPVPVGASLLAKKPQAALGIRFSASSFTPSRASSLPQCPTPSPD
jgi:hypothetical protein